MRFRFVLPAFFCLSAIAAPLKDATLQTYFSAEVAKIADATLAGFDTLAQWEAAKPKYREQLFEMLSLSPLPAKTDLRPVITGRIEREDFVVEKLHFQSLPGLYVAANLYLPKKVEKPLPTILYVCGHAIVKTNGVSYGNKTAYQHHGAWFARNGYACLLIDTIQLGEIEGIHHGTHREGMWWWNSRGYTSAGVEAWNCIRALDYLETRPEVDKTRFGVTGRSGGGAYSWWVTALDDRIKAAAPVAGITDLQNHVVDGVVEGHCDCMFFVNTYRWDYPLVAALAAPRPLLLANSDKDTIFPLDGVMRTHSKVARIYKLYGAATNFGVLITEGPHKDTQDLQVPVFRWFNRHLKREDPIIDMAATRFFSPQELKVFDRLPEDERTSRIHDTFVSRGNLESPGALRETLRQRAFGGWPEPSPFAEEITRMSTAKHKDIRKITFNSQPHVRLSMFLVQPSQAQNGGLRLHIIDENSRPALLQVLHQEFGLEGSSPQGSANKELLEPIQNVLRESASTTVAFLVVRGDGPDLPKREPRDAVQIRRRYMLVGQTLEGMRVWDIQRATALLKALPDFSRMAISASAENIQAVNLLYAALFSESIERLKLRKLPRGEAREPDYLNVARFTSTDRLLTLLSGRIQEKTFQLNDSGGGR